MKKITPLLIIIMIGIFLLPLGCSQENSDNTIRIGYFPNITHAQALVGFADGSFQQAFGSGVQVEEKIFNAGPTEIEAMMAGELDLGYIGPFPAMNGYHKSNGAIKILAGAANGGSLMVSCNNSIKNFEQFKGKKIAVPQFGNTQDLLLRKLLIDNNMKTTNNGGDITVVQVENPDILTLFRQGTLDGALVPEPWGSRLVKEAGANIVLDWNQIWNGGNSPVAVVIVRTEFLKDHPDLVKQFIDTHIALTKRLQKDPEKNLELMNRQIKKLTGKKLPEDVLKNALPRIAPTADISTAMLGEMADIALETGYMKQKPDLDHAFAKIK